MSHDPAAVDMNQPSGDDLAEVTTYRPVCGLAIVALLLGLVSPLAIFSSVLWVLPLLGIVVSLLALQKIASSDNALAGRPLAVIALGVSVGAGGMVLTHQVVQQRLLGAQATPWGLEWSRLVLEGRLEEALELTYEAENRRSAERLVAYYEENPTAKEKLESFREKEVVALLNSAPEGAKVEPIAVDRVTRAPGGRYAVLHTFRVVGPEGESRDFTLEMHKSPARGNLPGSWSISNSALGHPGRDAAR